MKNRKMWLLGLIMISILIITIAIVMAIVMPNKINDEPTNIITNVEEKVKEDNSINNNIVEDTFKKENITATVTKGKIAKEKSIYTDEENKVAIIPKGYTVVNDSGTINEGLVISDNENDDMNNSKYGNQFVWVPVATPILDVSKLSSDSQINSALKKQAEDGIYPMAIRLSNGNYASVLYDFSAIKQNTVVSATPATYGKDATRQEPANVSSDENDTKYQEEFNKFVISVRNDNGFWIARFETSIDEEKNVAQTKKDKVVLTNKNWYELYNTEKTLSNENTTSHMVWGCEWDQVMIWMKNIENSSGSQNHFYILDSTNKGNYSDLEIKTVDKTVIKKGGEAIRYGSGAQDFFAMKNIYDLAGNVFEWTMESYYGSLRVVRGGYCAFDGVTYPVSSRFWFQPYYSGDKLENIGSRMTIY